MLDIKYITKEELLKACPHPSSSGYIRVLDDSYRLTRLQSIDEGNLPNKVILRDEGIPVFNSRVYTTIISGSSYGVLLPKDIEVKSETIEQVSDWIEEALKELIPGRYYISGSYIYIHYPELTISNSMGMTHKIYDLVVRLDTRSSNGLGLYRDLRGYRFSATNEEISKGYYHSHLPSNGSNFCIGSTSAFSKYLNNFKDRLTKEDLPMLLAQLEAFLSWESLEGIPHVSMQVLGTNSEDITNLSYPEDQEFGEDLIKRVVLEEIDESVLILFNGMYILDLGLNEEKAKSIEERSVKVLTDADVDSDFLVDYDEQTNQFITNPSEPNSYTADVLARVTESVIYRSMGITPRIIEPENKNNESNIKKRLHPYVFNEVLTNINDKFLTTQNELYRNSVGAQA